MWKIINILAIILLICMFKIWQIEYNNIEMQKQEMHEPPTIVIQQSDDGQPFY